MYSTDKSVVAASETASDGDVQVMKDCGARLQFHYPQILSDPELEYLLDSTLWVK